LFVLLVIIWQFFACFWHLSERGLRFFKSSIDLCVC
jgi:hypothetical protein